MPPAITLQYPKHIYYNLLKLSTLMFAKPDLPIPSGVELIFEEPNPANRW